MTVLHVNDDNFEQEVLHSKKPVVVDFWAPWCGPCRAFGPVFEKVAGNFEASLKFVKINVDESPNAAASLQIRSIPTLAIFENGEPVAVKVGAPGEQAFTAFVEGFA